jgi:L-lactate dehydrogenase complex protein LldF
MKPAERFIQQSKQAISQPIVRERTEKQMQHYLVQHENAKKQFSNLALARERAAYYKFKVLENLDKYLIEYESSVLRKGGKVVWITDAEQALAEVSSIIKRVGSQKVLKSKSSITEELGLNEYLRANNIEVLETDTGDFIVDEAGETPWHTITPAMHKSESEIASLLNAKVGVDIEARAEHIVRDIRQYMRKDYFEADVFISGANFLIADSGMAAITENEGNVRMGMAFAKTYIVIAGIDKIIPGINELDTYWPLLATFGTGQKVTTYNTLIGPKQPGDLDGPSEFIVLLVDNERTKLLAQPDQRQTLSCIKCGACSNVCPVFSTIGGHSYGVSSNGPIGTITTPFTKGLEEYKHLSFASPLCGKCTEVCPVNIDIHNQISRTRRDIIGEGNYKKAESILWYSWKKIMLNRKNMNKSVTVKSFMLRSFFKAEWGNKRQFPELAEKSFNQLWREKNNL